MDHPKVSRLTAVAGLEIRRQEAFALTANNVFDSTPLVVVETMSKLPLRREIRAAMERSLEPLVMDLACGTGGTIRDIKREFPDLRMIGLDIRMDPSWKARGSLHRDVRFIESSFHQLLDKLPAGTIDLVYSHLGIRQSANPENVLEQVFVVMKPEGRFLFDFGPKSTFCVPLDSKAAQLQFLQTLQRIGFSPEQLKDDVFLAVKP
jgi:ubiquinone/menaquinone biosynthesis C-methylase UbiE